MSDNSVSFCPHEYPVITRHVHPLVVSGTEMTLHFGYLIGHLCDQFQNLPDSHKGNNRQTYTMKKGIGSIHIQNDLFGWTSVAFDK